MIDPASMGDWLLATSVAGLAGGLTLLITRGLRDEEEALEHLATRGTVPSV
jgi:hypothetical protein